MKIGILGFAHGHVGVYCTKWLEHPEYDIQLARAWDENPTRLEENASKFNIEKGECPYCVLNDPEIEAVVIASETSKHVEYVEMAAEAGKKIIVQKPLALTMAEADRIVNAVNKAKVPFTMAWQMRVDPQNQKMKEIMESGILGKIFHFQRRHNLGFCLSPTAADSWHTQKQYNRDIWADDSAHPIDLIHWLFGMPQSVTAEVDTFYNPKTPNDNGIAIFRYPGGPLVEVCCSFTCGGVEKTTEIIGDKGYLVQCYGDAVSCSMPRDEKAVCMKYYLREEKKWYDCGIESPHMQSVRLAGLVEPMSEFLHGKRGPIATAEDARDSLRMVLATYVSNSQGRRVAIDDPAIQDV